MRAINDRNVQFPIQDELSLGILSTLLLIRIVNVDLIYHVYHTFNNWILYYHLSTAILLVFTSQW